MDYACRMHEDFSAGAEPRVKVPLLRPRPVVKLDRRSTARERKFRDAAVEVFLEKGYRHARLSDIVARAKGSLATLYRIYGDKAGLAHAIMEESIENFGASLDALLRSPLPPREALLEASDALVAECLSPGRIVCHRIAIGDGQALPELRDWFFEHGVRNATETLALYFQREHDAGRLVVDDPLLAAFRFYNGVFARLALRGIAGLLGPDDIEAERALARAAVHAYLDGVLPRA